MGVEKHVSDDRSDICTYFIRFGATLTFHVHVIDIIIETLKDGLNPLLF